MDTNDNIIEETIEIIPVRRIKTNKTIKLNYPCKKIETKEECLSRADCLFNKTEKCQKKLKRLKKEGKIKL